MTPLPFRAEDASHLIAPREAFVERWALPNGTGPMLPDNVAKTTLALETAHQVARKLPGVVLKGGTPLQARIAWPPLRASVDVDFEWRDPKGILAALEQWAGAFDGGSVSVDPLRSEQFTAFTKIRFPWNKGEISVRVDVGEPGSSTKFSELWTTAPAPWQGSAQLRVPTLAAQAAQKLLLAAPPPFGRNLEGTMGHIGRRSLCKDLFDLHVLGERGLDPGEIQRAANVDIQIKGARIGWESPHQRVMDGAGKGWMRFAPPRGAGPEANHSLWRAFLNLRSSIAAPFGEGDLRIAGGCARHAVETMAMGLLDWGDAWTPRRSRQARRAWRGVTPIVPVIEVSDDYLAQRGLLEAWAKVAP